MYTTDCPFRAVDRAEDGTPFEEYLYDRAAAVARGPHELYQRVLIFIQQ